MSSWSLASNPSKREVALFGVCQRQEVECLFFVTRSVSEGQSAYQRKSFPTAFAHITEPKAQL